MKVKLLDIAHGRSDDKGDAANVGIIAYDAHYAENILYISYIALSYLVFKFRYCKCNFNTWFHQTITLIETYLSNHHQWYTNHHQWCTGHLIRLPLQEI